MTTKQHPGGDDAATLYALADALHKRALGQSREVVQHADAGDWTAAETALANARATQAAADALTAEADAS